MKTLLCFFTLSVFTLNMIYAQGVISSDGGSITITWDATVLGILNGAFDASDLVTSPASGDLDSDGVHIQDDEPSATLDADGFDGPNDVLFGGPDLGTVDASGVYAFDIGGGDIAWGVQPSGSRWSDANDNGHIVFKFQNTSGVAFDFLKIEYEIWQFNDENSSSTVEVYVTDQAEGATVNYGAVRSSVSTTEPMGASAWTLLDDKTDPNGIVISDLTIPNNGFFYLRFKIFDTVGGVRDIVAIDDIKVTGASTEIRLPVELTAFKGNYVKEESAILLSWATASEMNNKEFIVQRSENGKQFKNIDIVEGHGTTLEAQDYFYQDQNVVDGQNYYYRLKQVDFNGDFEYSDVISVKVSNDKERTAYFMPNPSSTKYTELVYTASEAGQASINVFNVTGKLVHQQLEGIQEGQNNLSLNLDQLPTGIYFVRLTQNNNNILKQLILE